MRFLRRPPHWSSALLLGAMATFTLVADEASARPDEEAPAADIADDADSDVLSDADADIADDADDADDADTADDADGEQADETADKAGDASDSADSSWGVGGQEEEGRYVPKGKTGKLRELEEEDAEDRASVGEPDLRTPGYAYLDTSIGFGTLMIASQATGPTDINPVASFLMAAGYRFGKKWHVSLRMPISSAASDGPIEPFRDKARDLDEYRQIATGNLELGAAYHLPINRYLQLPINFAFTVPTAQGDLFALPEDRGDTAVAIVNAAAMAGRGWQDRALFAYNRLSLSPGVGVMYEKPVGPGNVRAQAHTKLDLLFRTGGEDPRPDTHGDETTVNTVAINWVLGAGAQYELFRALLIPGLRMWLATATPTISEDGYNNGGSAFFLEPEVMSRVPFTESRAFGFEGGIAYMLPVGGNLGGEREGMGALRLRSGIYF